MNDDQREELMELIYDYGMACEKAGPKLDTKDWDIFIAEEQNCLRKIDDFLDEIQKS